MKLKYLSNSLLFIFLIGAQILTAQKMQGMDEMWGDQNGIKGETNKGKTALFDDGNYSMFIHWGIYSNIANTWKDTTYYGISEWIKHPRRANIPVEEYMAEAKQFNPVNFDAKAIAKLAKDAGMKYIVITSKHHDGFAMYDSKNSDFNIVDASPFARDPMKELAKACKEEGLGFGFYYSHNQDWTFPGGNGGPKQTEKGKEVDFDYYFKKKCLPQVKEITTQYGDIAMVWFDTPGKMEKKYVEELVKVVYKNQPNAMISGRAGHGLGDYQSLGDMNIPTENIEGLWETVDVTNDSWGYAWYDQNWKSPKQILRRTLSTVARGGTYMLNVGPNPDGTIPMEAQHALRASGDWIKRYPQVLYKAGPSPWDRKLPWGDVTVAGNKLNLLVYGYTTAHFGKWHLGGGGLPHGDLSAPEPKVYGYDETRVWNGNGPTWNGDQLWPTTRYMDDDSTWVHSSSRIVVDETIDFVKRKKEGDAPMFINLWLKDPHTPLWPTDEQRAPYKGLEPDKETYFSVLTDADFHVGRLLKALTGMGLDNNTLVIFSSDNGPAHVPPALHVGSTGGMKGRKVDIFQGGVNVPFIVRWPGHVDAGKIDSVSLLSAIDLLPTFAAVAGKELPKDYQPDGENFATIFENNTFERTKPLFWEWRFPVINGNPNQVDRWPVLAVREGDWKLYIGKNDNRIELYNIAKDQFESDNLSEEQPTKVTKLMTMVKSWKEELPE